MSTQILGRGGSDERGVASFSFSEQSGLTLVLTDGTSFSTPPIVGGVGQDGRGISSESYNEATGILTLTFTDGSTFQTGDLRGSDGEDGDNGTNAAFTVFTDQTAFDAYVPASNELVFLRDA